MKNLFKIIVIILVFAAVIFSCFQYFYGQNLPDNTKSEVVYEYIPEGFSETINDVYETGDAEAVYESGDKYIQITVLPKEGTTNIDTENAMIEDVYIKGCKGVYIQNSRFNAYVWADDEKQYTVLGNIERDEIKKVSEGLIIR